MTIDYTALKQKVFEAAKEVPAGARATRNRGLCSTRSPRGRRQHVDEAGFGPPAGDPDLLARPLSRGSPFLGLRPRQPQPAVLPHPRKAGPQERRADESVAWREGAADGRVRLVARHLLRAGPRCRAGGIGKVSVALATTGPNKGVLFAVKVFTPDSPEKEEWKQASSARSTYSGNVITRRS